MCDIMTPRQEKGNQNNTSRFVDQTAHRAWLRRACLLAFFTLALISFSFALSQLTTPVLAAVNQTVDPSPSPSETLTHTPTATITLTPDGTQVEASPTASPSTSPTGQNTPTGTPATLTPALTVTPTPSYTPPVDQTELVPTPTETGEFEEDDLEQTPPAETATLAPFPEITLTYPQPSSTPESLQAAPRLPGSPGLEKQAASLDWPNLARLLVGVVIIFLWLILAGWFVFSQRQIREK